MHNRPEHRLVAPYRDLHDMATTLQRYAALETRADERAGLIRAADQLLTCRANLCEQSEPSDEATSEALAILDAAHALEQRLYPGTETDCIPTVIQRP